MNNKMYVLVEFPYPSGSGLHIGHAFSFTGADVYARFKRAQGYEVIFPMGWDAFGLPTENYAIKMKQKPQEITKQNIAVYKKQMADLGFSFDWDREINTTDPKYYKWTQWIFIKLFEKGLAYKKEMPINWCPKCKIGLANEEVVANKCERCGSQVTRRTISQWVVRITNYADKLIEGLEKTNFIEKVKQSQINWIGKSKGALIKFGEIEIFTTRPDTLPSATFLVLAPEHEFVSKIDNEEVKKYIEGARKKSDFERGEMSKEKTGVFTGLYVVNPYNNKKMPIWVSDFVLSSYGTGAIMSVPTQDERDGEFAKKFGLDIIDNPNLSWEESLRYGKETSSYHLRDWIFSRQHYWGEPIPMVNCPKCGWVSVPEDQLPIVLPDVDYYEPTENGESPLSLIDSFVNTKCPRCGGEAKRETDTMPNWAGSDWYYLRYLDNNNDTEICSIEKSKKYMPVDIYIGGDEHNTLHLLYSRFIYNFLYDLGIVPESEPYKLRMSHGVILGPDNQRMSKSRGNVIVPDELLKKYGKEVLRVYLMFMGPFDSTIVWNEKTLIGVKRFLDRCSSYFKQKKSEIDSSYEVKVIINKLIKDVTEDINCFKFNTAIAKMMKSLSLITSNEKDIFKALLSPFVGDDYDVKWPVADDKYLIDTKIHLPIAVNGKVRETIEINSSQIENEDEVVKIALKSNCIQKWLEGRKIIKKFYVSGKMLNLVIA